MRVTIDEVAWQVLLSLLYKYRIDSRSAYAMDTQKIISRVNSFLHEATVSLVDWLNGLLPNVTNDWWNDCVLSSLSYTQREMAVSRKFSKLSDFDLAALLRIANKSWYDLRTVAYLPTKEREVVRDMMTVRNNWAHCSAELPGKDYISERVGVGSYIIGDTPMKNLRLSATARGILRDDLRRLPGGRSAVRRSWENYLSGKKPNHALTFDPDAAMKDRDSFFITAMHPLAKQAAEFFTSGETAYLHLRYSTRQIPTGNYVFSIYAWKYAGFNTYTRLITVCENEMVANDLPFILEEAINGDSKTEGSFDWSALEDKHVQLWLAEREKYKRDVNTTVTFKLESLANTHRNRIRSLEQQVRDAFDESIRRMRQSELETAQEQYECRVSIIKETSDRADIYATLLVNGVISILEG